MEYEYDSQTINPRNAPIQHSNGNASVHFATPFPTVNCQLSTVNWIHTFSAKEKDLETGLSYFGSRYYSSDLSIWLSVDPMSDKYPSLSPYTYCADNPIKLVDPNGEDIVELLLAFAGKVDDIGCELALEPAHECRLAREIVFALAFAAFLHYIK